jgi:hypothetical protein
MPRGQRDGSLRPYSSISRPELEEYSINNFMYSYFSFRIILAIVVEWWLRHYATNRKVSGSRPAEVNEFLQFT